MNKYALEVQHIGGDELTKSVSKEFENPFFIVARTDEIIVLGDGTKNIQFSRKTFKPTARVFFDKSAKLTRK